MWKHLGLLSLAITIGASAPALADDPLPRAAP